MFIMIHEDGQMVLLKELTEDDLKAADDGVVELIDVSVADEPMKYSCSEWVDIESDENK